MAAANLSVEGDIATDIKKFYSKHKKKAVCKFAIKYVYVHLNQMAEQWFNFICYEELAEYIAENYKRGSKIDIIKSVPSRDKMVRGGKEFWVSQWIVREIGEVVDGGYTEPAMPMESQGEEYEYDDTEVPY